MSSAGGAVFRSADWLIFVSRVIRRSADDSGCRPVYGDEVSLVRRILRLLRDPGRADLALACFLLAAAELQIWLGNAAGSHRVAAFLAPVVATTVAIRRRFP